MIYFGIALFCTGVFIVQFILSFIIGELDFDSDVDLDADGVADFNISDLLSFKGLINFGIGFSWSMYFSQEMNQFLAACIAIVVGLVFVIILYLVYILAYKLKNEIKPEKGEDLLGRSVEIYLPLERNQYSVHIIINGRLSTIIVSSESSKKYITGDKAEIIKFENGIYYIL